MNRFLLAAVVVTTLSLSSLFASPALAGNGHNSGHHGGHHGHHSGNFNHNYNHHNYSHGHHHGYNGFYFRTNSFGIRIGG
jgi:hypothetical protein